MASAPVRGGSNTLRGGKRTYNATTLNDNWVEDRYDPRFPPVRPACATTTAQAELEATKTTTLRYGGQLTHKARFDDTIDYGNTIGYDKTAYPEKWESVTHSVHAPPVTAKPTEFSTSFKLPDNAYTSPGKAEEYRDAWTRSKRDMSGVYTSEANRAVKGTVNDRFNVSVTRKHPGVPKSVEEFRERIVAKGGVDGVVRLKRLLTVMDTSGDGVLSRKEFKFGLADFGLDFSEEEFFALWNYFDRDHSGFIDWNEFLTGLRGRMNERRQNVVAQAFQKLDRTGDGVVRVDDLRGVYDVSHHPAIKSGSKTPEQVLAAFLSQWESGRSDGKVTFEEWCQYYDDISATISSDEAFEAMMRSAWRLGDEKK